MQVTKQPISTQKEENKWVLFIKIYGIISIEIIKIDGNKEVIQRKDVEYDYKYLNNTENKFKEVLLFN